MRSILILLLVSIFYTGSVFLAVQGKTFRLDSDYDSNFPIISYVVDTIRNEKRLPFWNPYVTMGISVFGDPLSGVTYLPYILPMLVFGVPEGLWVVIGIHAFLAGVFMWMFLRESKFSLWGGMLYMGSGAFAARVAAGHIEKVLSYPWYPLFLLFLFRQQAPAIGVIMGIVFLTGDVYGLLFMGIFYGVVGVIRGIRGIGGMMVGFAVVAAIKLVPFIRDVMPVMERFSSFDAARGSIPVWLSWLPFIMPWGVEFYDRPIVQRLFGFWYNWYEYYAFIGLPVVFLVWLPRIIKRREVKILLILLAVGITYAARGYVYSPWYGLAPVLEWFRVPHRMYGALTSIVVALIVTSLKKNTSWVLLWGMLFVTFLVSGYQMTRAFEPPRTCCTQLHRIREKVRIIDYYYGWLPKPLWENQK
ncbi:MAG: hypothetical protein AAB481_02530 [Patescibacteria group bacterium]